MASTHFVANLTAGEGTLTLKIYTRGTSTIINTGGDTAAEDGTRAGWYDWTVTEAVTGIQDAVITNGSGTIRAWLQTPPESADDTGTYVLEEIRGERVDVHKFGGSAGTFSGGRPEVNTTLIEGSDATDQINAACDTALTDADVATATALAAVELIVDAILVDTAEIGAAGAGLTALAPAATALSTANWTNARAGYLDNLNISENVAGTSEVTAIQNNTRVVRVVPTVIERPDSGTTTYRIELFLYDSTGNMEAPDSAPTVDLVDESGNDRTSRLDSTTMTLVSTGRYRSIYTATDTDDVEQLVWTFSVIEGGATRLYGNASLVADTTAVDFTSSDRAQLQAVYNKLPSKSYLAGSSNSDGDIQLDEATGSATLVDLVFDEAMSGHATAGTFGKAVIDVLADTNELQTDWADGGRLDVILDARASQASVDDLPTNTELATALAAADDATLAALAAVAADLPQRITKNTALAAFSFAMFSSTDHTTPATGLTVTAERSIDGAAFGACANAVTELSGGVYLIDLAASDLNGNVITLKFSATGADTQFLTITTQPT